jgi:hypothetical protein
MPRAVRGEYHNRRTALVLNSRPLSERICSGILGVKKGSLNKDLENSYCHIPVAYSKYTDTFVNTKRGGCAPMPAKKTKR